MNKIFYLLILFTTLIFSACAVKGHLASGSLDSGAVTSCGEGKFDELLVKYIDTAKEETVCGNLDQVASLQSVAEQEGKTLILENVNLAAIFFAAVAQNLDVEQAQQNIKDLLAATGDSKLVKAAAPKKKQFKDFSIAVMFKTVLNDDCMTQARFETLISLFEQLYSTHGSILRATAKNTSLQGLLGYNTNDDGTQGSSVFDDYMQCFSSSDSFFVDTFAPFLKSIDIQKTGTEVVAEYKTTVRPKIPDCFRKLIGMQTEAEMACNTYRNDFWNAYNGNTLCNETLKGIIADVTSETCVASLNDDGLQQLAKSLCNTPQATFLRGMEVGRNTGSYDCNYLNSALDETAAYTGTNVGDLSKYTGNYGWLPYGILDYVNSGRCTISCGGYYSVFGSDVILGDSVSAIKFMQQMSTLSCNMTNATSVCNQYYGEAACGGGAYK
ncbi:MAG: hypothetical protein WCQ53_06835 [bacterium]